uniref:Putative transcriptional regulator n=1 Tax=Arthrobacter sp. NyZ415 TaxID=683157 RepID=D0V106_9MICC|nr:putative transcriptional regulator [Arthrobacter sp. NyZ415]
MAWNTERTKLLLLATATREFSEKGFAGARIDRIARNAGVNKERIYQYFGNKVGLFDAALADLVPHDLDVPLEAAPVLPRCALSRESPAPDRAAAKPAQEGPAIPGSRMSHAAAPTGAPPGSQPQDRTR